MRPAAGENLLRYRGDWVYFQFEMEDGSPVPAGWRVFLRTNLGREQKLEEEIIHAHSNKWPLEGQSWRDMPIPVQNGKATIEIPLYQVGYFEAKLYALDERGMQIWPDGANVGISVHPDFCRTGNIIYCAFTRLFGENITAKQALPEKETAVINQLDDQGFTCIPPSGKFRDLKKYLPHITETLGCRIVHLLPVNPTPTTMARMGRFGSPYASLDLTGIDPALVEFERETTSVDQFRELADAIHQHGARLMIDLAINHTGWGAWLHDNHPEWYVKDAQGSFVSPGAWGVTWGDLSELNTMIPDLWNYLAGVFITWCQRGVDGFRCDAGYKIPMEAWRYIISRVHREFPEAFFLLEGLGGSWEATETLLTQGRMQFAYSELFQNYSGGDVSRYLDYALKQSVRKGVWIHYSETHDNNRLAAKGRQWSLFRNQLCALTSVAGGFGFTCGVEWLAAEKILVHQRSGLAWDNPDNIVPELSKLNKLLSEHPCFFDGARLSRLSNEGAVYVLRRDSAEGTDSLWIFANTDMEHDSTISIPGKDLLPQMTDLLTGKKIAPVKLEDNAERWVYTVPAGTCWCLAASTEIHGLAGNDYRQKRAIATWALVSSCKMWKARRRQAADWKAVAELAEPDPVAYLGAVNRIALRGDKLDNWLEQVRAEMKAGGYDEVIELKEGAVKRVNILPKDHWLYLKQYAAPFRVQLRSGNKASAVIHSVATKNGHIAAFSPGEIAEVVTPGDGRLILEGMNWKTRRHPVSVHLLYVSENTFSAEELKNAIPNSASKGKDHWLMMRGDRFSDCYEKNSVVLLTNGRGGMSRICADLGTIQSKYDCLLGANLNPEYPVDRHVFVKRVRIWVNADGFISQLNANNLAVLKADAPVFWDFIVAAGDARTVQIRLTMDLLEERNTLVMKLERLKREPRSQWTQNQLPAEAHVTAIVRLDVEDRNFHTETHLNDGARYHFTSHTQSLSPDGKLAQCGFHFTPAQDRGFRAYASAGQFHSDVEWCENIWHPVEGSRGQTDHGDAYSPGWFELPLDIAKPIYLVADAEQEPVSEDEITRFEEARKARNEKLLAQYKGNLSDPWERELVLGMKAFLVRRGKEHGKTIIAGYPWFLDWGRDTLISARGYLAAGYDAEVLELIQTFARMEKGGTLPNVIYGDNDSNRDTVDAPLWLGVVIEEYVKLHPKNNVLNTPLEDGRTLLEILRNIANGYLKGTSNGIKVDQESGLVWSPSHFTWMDTNYPAGTPRCGYPIEIQALWIRLLRQLEREDKQDRAQWKALADRATASLRKLYWLPQKGWFADGLWAENKAPASQARVDDALRPNQLIAVAFGFCEPAQARSAVQAALRYLVIPGAIRSLAPLPVDCLAPVYGSQGSLLNDPGHPYWPRYEGDEDTRRKPAYHNGTAWGFMFPVFCEAMVQAWPDDKAARSAAKAYLRSAEYWMNKGALGQIAEIMDGDLPHTQRGCDAQAWSICETLRVWKLLKE